MATVSNTKQYFMHKEYQHKITVTSNGEFRVYYPPEVAKDRDQKYASASTLKEAEKKHKQALEDFENRRQITKKVIAVNFKGTQATMSVLLHQVMPPHDKTIHFSHGHGYCLAAAVYEETQTKSPDGTIYFKYERLREQPFEEGSSDDNIVSGMRQEHRPKYVFDWSQELEDMLADILNKTLILAGKLLEITAVANIEQAALEYSGKGLLTAPVEDEEDFD